VNLSSLFVISGNLSLDEIPSLLQSLPELWSLELSGSSELNIFHDRATLKLAKCLRSDPDCLICRTFSDCFFASGEIIPFCKEIHRDKPTKIFGSQQRLRHSKSRKLNRFRDWSSRNSLISSRKKDKSGRSHGLS
jgi:hypothetical protein